MMRALQLVQPGVLAVVDVPIPDIGPDEVLLNVSGAERPISSSASPWPGRAGLSIDVELFPLTDAITASDRLEAGSINGRAVLVP